MALIQSVYEDMNEDGDNIDWSLDFDPIDRDFMEHDDCTPTTTANNIQEIREFSGMAARRPDNPMFEYINKMIIEEKIRMTMRKRDIEIVEVENSPTNCQSSLEYSMTIANQSMMRRLKSARRSGSANNLLLETSYLPKTLFPKPLGLEDCSSFAMNEG